jgi:hypothetical protein
MKKLLLILTISIFLTSCVENVKPEGTVTEQYGVTFLFEKDGIKMYRFFDKGHYHYFTSKGETMTSQSSGKTNYEESIN